MRNTRKYKKQIVQQTEGWKNKLQNLQVADPFPSLPEGSLVPRSVSQEPQSPASSPGASSRTSIRPPQGPGRPQTSSLLTPVAAPGDLRNPWEVARVQDSCQALSGLPDAARCSLVAPAFWGGPMTLACTESAIVWVSLTQAPQVWLIPDCSLT